MIFEGTTDAPEEPFEKEISLLDDSRSEIMTEHQHQPKLRHHNQPSRPGQGLINQNRSQSLMPQPKHISVNDEPTLPHHVDVKLGHHLQMSSGYRRNPMLKKNAKMWKKIIQEV